MKPSDMKQSRARGVMLGLACGDALGGPLEFMGPREIQLRFGTLRDMVGGGWLSLRPGETTDDTAMALDLARSLAELNGVDPDDVAARWVRWLNSEPKDVGNATRHALGLIRDGTPWDQAGRLVDEQQELMGGALGNGSLMRCAPVSIRYSEQPDLLIQASLVTSRITHANPICEWACAALNLVIAALLHGRSTDAVTQIAPLIEDPAVRGILLRVNDVEESSLKTGGHVLDTLESALWAFLTSESLEDAVVRSANLGGDTDTRAAVTGALPGARYGEDAIPARWLDVLENKDELSRLADELVTLGE